MDEKKTWSDELIKTTREFLSDSALVQMKHIGGLPHCMFFNVFRFKELGVNLDDTFFDGYNGEHYVLQSLDKEEKCFLYNSIDEIIEAGWAVD